MDTLARVGRCISETLASADSDRHGTATTTALSRPSSPTAPLHLTCSTDNDADLTLPLLSPTAPLAAAESSPDRPYFPHQPKSLAGIAMRAFCLGAALSASLMAMAAVLLATHSPLWRLPFFVAALATFHFLEFWTTAAYNTRAAEVGSFLLTANWPAYAIAHTAAGLECLAVGLLFPRGGAWHWALPSAHFLGTPLRPALFFVPLGLALMVAGQTVRTAAMVQAGASFNHLVQQRRQKSHVLVTTGIYARLRHPSYCGFFWWALGTQLVLGNVVCFVLYAMMLWRFFSTRVKHEEVYLVKFFGNEYEDYRKKVGTKMPFI